MKPLQLSFLNDIAATPIDQLGKKKQAKSQQAKTILVESSCRTRRAAELLAISVSTLYRARKAGKEYKLQMDRSIYWRKCLERLIAVDKLNFKRKLNMIYIANRITPLSQSRATTKGVDITLCMAFITEILELRRDFGEGFASDADKDREIAHLTSRLKDNGIEPYG